MPFPDVALNKTRQQFLVSAPLHRINFFSGIWSWITTFSHSTSPTCPVPQLLQTDSIVALSLLIFAKLSLPQLGHLFASGHYNFKNNLIPN